MSGDVQPRKRKDKRKKREGSSLGNIHEPLPPKFRGKSFDDDADTTQIIGSTDQGEKIHVHNDHGIGGNICVKIVFFCLLGALVTVVGIIFIHSRGSTDVDLPSIEDSRFADYFTGWLDDATDDHGHGPEELPIEDDGPDEHDEDEEHEEVEGEPDHGEDKEEQSEETEAEKSEEDHVEEQEIGDEAKENTDEGSLEGDENEEEDNVDDSGDEEDEAGKIIETDEEDNEVAPKFKVVHRFRHFFNKRKQLEPDKAEEGRFVKKKRYIQLKRDVEEIEVDEAEELEEDENKDITDKLGKDEDIEKDEDEDENESKDTTDKIEDDDDDEDENENESKDTTDKIDDDDDEDENEGKDTTDKIEEDDDDEDENENESKDTTDKIDDDDDEDENEGKDTSDKIEDDEEEDEEKSQTDDGSMEEEDGKYEHTGNVESEEVGKERQDETDEDEEIEKVENEEKDEEAEEEDLSEEGEKTDDEQETLKDDLGLDEIDESEEDLEEDEKISLSDRGISIREKKEETEEEDKLEETDETFGTDDVKDEEIEEVESKILDIEEKLNQILREKRRKVEQRKMELEEIEIGPPLEENEDEEKEAEEQEETESNGVAVKLIVGIALIIAAHMVLIQKWNSLGNAPADEKSEAETEDKQVISVINGTEPIISRRQTLVPETSDLNIDLANEFEEETGEEDYEEEEDEEGEEDEDEEQDEDEYEEEEEEEDNNEEPDYCSDKALVKEGKLWKVDYGNRLTSLTKANEEYAEEEVEELDDGEFEEEDVEEEEEEEDEEEEDVEEDDYDWKRLEPVNKPVEDEPPVPPPRRSHMSGERRGGPQDIDDLSEISTFDDFWDGADSIDQADRGAEEEQEDKDTEDNDIQEDYKFAEDLIDNSPREALNVYEAILSKKPEAVAALIGRAKVLDKVAEKERSNQYLKEAINAYKVILTRHENDLKNEQFLELAERCINRMRFGGYFKTAVEIHKLLIRRFPKDPKYRNDLAVTYLFLNEIPSARALLNDTLRMWPKNGFALVHYGFILKTADNKYAEAADLLMAGIRTREPGVIDGRFFFHLGDALNRLGRGKEAIEWYDQGVKEGLFLSRYQRSLYNVNRLKGQPWWTHKETTYQDFFKKLEDNWQRIREEGLTLLNAKGMNLFKEEAENLKDTGDWRQLDLYFRGKKQPNCDRAPFTCSLISNFLPASTCTRGQIKFSVMLPSTHVWPHCGPTNCRLRSHLGLLVPKNTFIRVAEETRSWEEGKLFVFDDSFEHEVWHNGTGPRLVLIVDVWHPELTPKERKYLSPI